MTPFLLPLARLLLVAVVALAIDFAFRQGLGQGALLCGWTLAMLAIAWRAR